MPATRLSIDSHVIGYWGFDEANETDMAVDEAGSNRHLTLTDAAAVVPARLGNGRQFNGTSTRGDVVSSVPFRLNAMSMIVWATLDSVLQTGSKRRTIIACDGANADPTIGGIFYYLGVDNTGAIIHEYHDAAGHLIQWKTAGGAFLTGRYYSIALTRVINGNWATLSLYINNQSVAWTSVTSDAAPIVAPIPGPAVPAPATNAQTFKVGISDKYPDAFWAGVLDELSVHDVARAKCPYLDAAYFRLTLAASFSRLSAVGNVKTLGGVDMGGGVRWWCYERDQSLYVIRENSLGLFADEILLTTGGFQASGALMPGGVQKPALAYDRVNDVLLVAFLGAGKVWKITAKSEDSPSTQNMPFTQDTPGVLKVVDNTDVLRDMAGQPATNGDVGTNLTTDGLVAPTITFLNTPSFGLAVEGTNPHGYFVYRVAGGAEVLFATITQATTKTGRSPEAVGNYWFVAITTRVHGVSYYARARTSGGAPGDAVSNVVTDFLGRMRADVVEGILDPRAQVLSRDGDAQPMFENVVALAGQGNAPRAFAQSTLTPLKIGRDDALITGNGEALPRVFTLVTRTPVKIGYPDALLAGGGSTVTPRMYRTNGPRYNA